MRADHGVTRRANSVLPIAPQNIRLDFAIDSVIDFYNCRDLVPRFQLTEASHPSNLDSELDQRGFTIGLQVELWTSPITSFLAFEMTCPVELSEDRKSTRLNSSHSC